MIHNLYSVGSNYGHPFDRISKRVLRVDEVSDLSSATSADALLLHGGSDIGPWMYGHEVSKYTHVYEARDAKEWPLLQEAIKKGMPIIGICRGGQMLCAAAGGFLLQDVGGHHGYHKVTTDTGDEFSVNSIHHQMMAGFEKVDHELIAWSSKNQSNKYLYNGDKLFEIPDGWVEPEFIYFPKIKGYAIQWHPEMLESNHKGTKLIIETMERTIK